MAILDFKPHQLYVEIVEGGYYDKMGDWHEGSREWVNVGRCDAVPANGENPTIHIPDGSVAVYDYTLILPSNCREFLYGQRVKLSMFGDTERIYSVVGFNRYQLQAKLYIRATN